MLLVGLPIGVAIGVLLGLVGSGGAILTTPLLVLIGNFTFAMASTGALFVVLFASITAAILRGVKKSHFKTATSAALLGSFGSIPGAWLANQISESTALVILVAVLVLASFTSWNNEGITKVSNKWLARTSLVILFVLTGFLTGLTGVGGGYILIPGLLMLTAIGFREAVSISLLIIIANSLVSLVVRFSQSIALSTNEVQVISIVVLAAVIGSVFGAKLSVKINRRVAQRGFAVLALVLAAVVTFEIVFIHPWW